ncbi:hypothetical protein SUGI_0862170 [Cryptomeria japonica]|nr:hypothetical protein SUGI_0862170 [Cryptomeria japonica]
MADVVEQDCEISNHEISGRENSRSTDMGSIVSFQQLIRESWRESKKLWRIAGPAIFTRICSYSMEIITRICAGHMGVVELAAVPIHGSVIGGLVFGFMESTTFPCILFPKFYTIRLKELDLYIHIRCRISEES